MKQPEPQRRLRFRLSGMILYILFTKLSQRIGGKPMKHSQQEDMMRRKQRKQLSMTRRRKGIHINATIGDESKQSDIVNSEEQQEENEFDTSASKKRKKPINLHTWLVPILLVLLIKY
jgi:hypothetical protein